MSLTVSNKLLLATTHADFEENRQQWSKLGGDREIIIDTAGVSQDGLMDLERAAGQVNDSKTARAINSILAAWNGDFIKPIASFKSFQAVLESFLRANLIDGWIYVEGYDGKLHPELVTNVSFDDDSYHRSSAKRPSVRIHTAYYGRTIADRGRAGVGVIHGMHSFEAQDVSRRRVADALSSSGIFHETPELKKAYDASMERYDHEVRNAFSKQFRATGRASYFEDDPYNRRSEPLNDRRVVHDLDPSMFGATKMHTDSILAIHEKGLGAVPEHPVVRLFDLRAHEYLWVHADNLTSYVYDKSLREKLVLPDLHRDLLDVLTTNLDAFVDDFIEGKNAGNVILCKGIPGVGKTLTAEVYAELIEKPLYYVHTGTLGTTVESIEMNLQHIFHRNQRLGCILLIDEADVFVSRRGGSLEQNAIVAEFLRALEYFAGLMFLTTNRADEIDDAIISRCAAIINYETPSPENAARIWRVMAAQFKTDLEPSLIDELVAVFKRIAPRDMKMLLRLALRISIANKEPLTLDVFRRCAMFRAIQM